MRMRIRCFGTASWDQELAIDLTRWPPLHSLAFKDVAELQSCLLMVIHSTCCHG